MRAGVWARAVRGLSTAGARSAVAGVVLLAALSPPASALTFPSAGEVISRVLATVRHADLTSANVLIAFRIGTPASAPPQCVFRGRLEVWPDRSTLTVSRWTPTPVCWVIQRFVLARLLSDRDHTDALLPRFRFEVLGESLVEGRPHYLVYGQALASETEPRWMIGWVDYTRGVVTEGTLRYGWGRVDTVQEYGRAAGTWLPVHQHLDIPRFGASLDITYDDIRLISRP